MQRGFLEPGAALEVEEVLTVHHALDDLEAKDPHMAEVVKLRYFGGLSIEETAQALGESPRSIYRSWTAARAWLKRRIDQQ